MHTNFRAKALLFLAATVALVPAMAAEYWLQTGATTVAGVPMWGYALCGTGATPPATCGGAVTVPGPALVVPPGEGLTVHLTNTLPSPTSLVIAGQVKQEGMQPVWFDAASSGIFTGARPAGNTTARVRSFDREAAAGGGAVTYTWASIKPGTYLYSSGTQPQVQVQMGLYGAMSKDAGVGQVAYSQGATNVGYSNQATLLYSEVDPALHAAVAGGTYGGSGPHSTLVYRPSFFLINGKAWPDGLDPFVTVPAGQPLLLRLLNAGLKTHVPTLHGQYWRLIAEDGNPLPWLSNPRQQYTAFLPAGKTVDVLLRPDNASTTDTLRYAIFDSRHFDTSNGAAGGMLARFAVAPAAAEAPQFDTAPPPGVVAGSTWQYAAHAVASAGHAVQYSLVTAPPDMAVNAGSGLVTWTPVVAGTTAVTLRATDAVVPTLFRDQSFNVVVTAPPVNHAPQAKADSYTGVIHAAAGGAQVVAARGGVLANDTDADNNTLVAECAGLACVPGRRVVLGADGGFSLASSLTTGNVVFTYRARDNGSPSMVSANVNATVTMIANRAPVGAADNVSAPRCTFRDGTGSKCLTGAGAYVPLSFNLASNDTDPDSVTIDAANQLPLAVARLRPVATGASTGSLTSITTSSGGTATIAGGMVTYVPQYNFAGTDRFYYRAKDKLGKESGSTTTDTNNTGSGWIAVTVTVK